LTSVPFGCGIEVGTFLAAVRRYDALAAAATLKSRSIDALPPGSVATQQG
jgi:hypothetical protein